MASIGLGLALTLGLATPAPTLAQAPRAPAARVPTIYHKSRSFRIPFNVDPTERARLKAVQLWVSEDAGFTWKLRSETTPDRPSFTFRATRDEEYWFAVRTLDMQGKLYPGEDSQVEPSMKVIVDTKPPSIVLEPDGRRGSLASVRWEVRDEYLVLGSLVLEYQAEGAREWRKVPISRPSLIGSESWDAGTAEPLRVRASVSDRAGNAAETYASVSEGTARNPGVAIADASEFAAPPPISQISAPAGLPPVQEAPREREPLDSLPGPPPAVESPEAPGNEPDPFASPGGPEPGPSAGPSGAGRSRSQSLLVGSPRFPLAYAVDDAGPDGPSVVELWVTQDGGRSWSRREEDSDRVSPFQVDLGGEGTFGVCLVARSASGLGDQPPAPGDPPQLWVEVDSTPPSVVLNTPQVGTGKHVGKVAITWRATDFHLAAKPVVLLWRSDQPGAAWQPITTAPLPNTGRFIWTTPTNIPPRLHLRIEVSDTVGNKGSAETTDTGPIVVDRTRPRSRIIGLDPSARTSAGAAGGTRR